MLGAYRGLEVPGCTPTGVALTYYAVETSGGVEWVTVEKTFDIQPRWLQAASRGYRYFDEQSGRFVSHVNVWRMPSQNAGEPLVGTIEIVDFA